MTKKKKMSENRKQLFIVFCPLLVANEFVLLDLVQF